MLGIDSGTDKETTGDSDEGVQTDGWSDQVGRSKK